MAITMEQLIGNPIGLHADTTAQLKRQLDRFGGELQKLYALELDASDYTTAGQIQSATRDARTAYSAAISEIEAVLRERGEEW